MTDDTYRILSPSEYRALLAAIPKLDYRMMVETMMNTGMRYEELRKFRKHPEWFDAKNRVINIPADVNSSKANRFRKAIRGRVVHLTPQFSEKLEIYLSTIDWGENGKKQPGIQFPRKESMNKNLKRWMNIISTSEHKTDLIWAPNCKTFRKTWETWLIFAGYDSLKVAVSQGHTQTVQISSYQNLIGSLKNEVDAVKELTRGWMT